jgi:cytochrome c oxidase cbb3-type subunit I
MSLDPSRTQATPDDLQQRAIIDRSVKSAVTFFLLSGAVWLLVASVLGLLASIKQHNAEILACEWLAPLNWGRLQPAFTTALVYGWSFQAAFGVALFIMARVCRTPLTNGPTLIVSGHFWNLGVLLGVVSILGGAQHPAELLEFGRGAWLLMLGSFLMITVWLVMKFVSRPKDSDYVSQWYIVAACLWFPLLFITGNCFTRFGGGSGLHAAAVGSWYGSSLVYLFLVPMGLAAGYYVIPKVVGRPIHSYSLAQGGFWGLAVLGGWTGLQKFIGGPFPQVWSGISILAQWLLLVPIVMVGANHYLTVRGQHGKVHSSPSMRFTFGGSIFLGIASLVAAGAAGLPGLSAFTQVQDATQFLFVYGFFGFSMFGAIYFIMPRLTGCEWLSSKFIRLHFWFNVYGVGTILVVMLTAGLTQAQSIGTWDDSVISLFDNVRGYFIGRTLGWMVILFANIVFVLHLVLMSLRLGRRSEQPTLLSHHSADDFDHAEVLITTEGAEAK